MMEENQVDTISSKPIQKREKTGHEIEAEEVDEPIRENDKAGTSAQTLAKEQLISFLGGKGIDAKYAEKFQVHVRMQKKKRSDGKASFSVSYTGPEGSILQSKQDVLIAINSMIKWNKRDAMDGDSMLTTLRQGAHFEAQATLQHYPPLPANIGGITVQSFGEISQNPLFHTPIQIYPNGYIAEKEVAATSRNGPQALLCEIRCGIDHNPKFCITNKTTGQAFAASTEIEVWKKFDAFAEEGSLSFFNLDIELLIEGLEGALDCKQYKFHAERGYGETYFTHEQAMAKKMAFLAKSIRELRNQQREQAKFMSPEEKRKSLEQRKKVEEEERDLVRRNAGAERERKEQAREQEKRKRDSEKELRERSAEAKRQYSERKKKEDHTLKEQQRQEDQRVRERQRTEDKLRAGHRKDVTADVKRFRADAQAQVLQAFDREEDLEDQDMQSLAPMSSPSSAKLDRSCSDGDGGDGGGGGGGGVGDDGVMQCDSSLGSVLASLQSCGQHFKGVGNPMGGSGDGDDPFWDDLFQVGLCIHVFRDLLKLSMSTRLSEFFDTLSTYSAADPAAVQIVVVNHAPSATVGSSLDAPAGSSAGEADDPAANEKGGESMDTDLREGVVAHCSDDEAGAAVPASSGAVDADSSQGNSEAAESKEVELAVVAEVAEVAEAKPEASVGKKVTDDEDEEWDESMALPMIPASESNALSPEASNTKSLPFAKNHESESAPIDFVRRAEAQIDRIQLGLVAAFVGDLHSLLDLDEKESEGSRKGRKAPAVRFPLNQLTWAELARMGLVAHLMKELGKTTDEVQHAVRGSKASNYRIAKSIVRNIRYRFLARAKSQVGIMYLDTSSVAASFDAFKLLDKDDHLLQMSLLLMPQSRGAPSASALPPSRHSLLQIAAGAAAANGDSDVAQSAVESLRSDSALEANTRDRSAPSMQNIFQDEAEMLSAVADIAADAKAADVYRRCAKVFLKIVNMSPAKNFIWEVDSEANPDYYSMIKRAMAFSHIATNLVNRAYGDAEAEAETETETGAVLVDASSDGLSNGKSSDPPESVGNGADMQVGAVGRDVASISREQMPIAEEFYSDMRQVLTNCITFNTEMLALVAQAQKVLQAMTRHVQQWIFRADRPPVASCDEQHCIISFEPIPPASGGLPAQAIKCGRCCGVVSLRALNAMHQDPAAVIPGHELVDQSHEEYFCPLCVREDSVTLSQHFACSVVADVNGPNRGAASASSTEATRSPYVIDEWGPRALVPFLFNERDCHLSTRLRDEFPSLYKEVKALELLSDPSWTSVMDATAESSTGSHTSKLWSLRQRLVVLLGMCETMKGSSACLEVTREQHAECQKLGKISEVAKFREGDFMNTVRAIAGDEGVLLCRSMLDGIEDDEQLVQHRLIGGRCIICRSSTYPEDCDADDQVFLCDGCNADVHLKCTDLTAIPTGEWNCSACAERIAIREAKLGHNFDNIDPYRSKKVEDDLLDALVEQRAIGSDLPSSSTTLCSYCAFSEFEVCSPLVIGQSRREHEAHLAISRPPLLDGVFPSKSSTKVLFVHENVVVPPPPLEMPYFPPEIDGRPLVKMHKHLGDACSVHEYCALLMFQARMDRERHALRRRRRLIAERAISMSGICCRPLGLDDLDSEYWKYPNSDDIFVRLHSASSSALRPIDHDERHELLRMIGRGAPSSSPHGHGPVATGGGGWRRISDVDTIRRIVDALGKSERESELRQNLVSILLIDRKSGPEKSQDDGGDDTKEENGADVEGEGEGDQDDEDNQGEDDAEEAVEDKDVAVASTRTLRKSSGSGSGDGAGREKDSTPVALKLIKGKGANIPSEFIINMESVSAVQDNEPCEVEDLTHRDFFTFGKKYFAIALVNKLEKRVRVPKHSVTIVYQIHLAGSDKALAYTPLDEAWSDNIFYFATLVFKRSGHYTISFIAQGQNVSAVKPLVFNITVSARIVKCGPADALDRLVANGYIDKPNRIVTGRLRQWIMNQLDASSSELSSVKSAIFCVYAALPLGALVIDPDPAASSGPDGDDVLNGLAEPGGWNDALDQVWRGAVESATGPVMLMECVLLLEYYIQRQWMLAPNVRLLNALPNAHFAIRCCTLSSVALRVFCLDKALAYEKVFIPPRVSRGSAPPVDAIQAKQFGDNFHHRGGAGASGSGGQSSRRGRPLSVKPTYAELDDDEEEFDDDDDDDDANEVGGDDGDDAGRRSSRRNSRSSAGGGDSRSSPRSGSRPSRKRRGLGEDDEDEDEDDDGAFVRKSARNRTKVVSYAEDEENTSSRASSPRGEVPRKRSKRNHDDDDDDDDEEEEDNEEGEGEEVDEEVDEEEEGEVDFEGSGDKQVASARASADRRSGAAAASDADEDDAMEEDGEEEEEGQEEEEEADGAMEVDIDRDMERLERSRGGGGDEDGSIDMNMRYLAILRHLKQHSISAVFQIPVDLKVVTDYKKIVKEPMDLGTIAKNVMIGVYENDHAQFAKSVRQVWANCFKYNPKQSLYCQYAAKLKAVFECLYASWITAEGRPVNPNLSLPISAFD